jgi:hypothetical protein
MLMLLARTGIVWPVPAAGPVRQRSAVTTSRAEANLSAAGRAGRGPSRTLAAGLILGLGLANRHSAGLFAGALLSGGRAMVLNRWFLAGTAIAVTFTVPDLWWQAQHHWAPIAMTQALNQANGGLGNVGTWVIGQVIMVTLALVWVWLAAVVLARRSGSWVRNASPGASQGAGVSLGLACEQLDECNRGHHHLSAACAVPPPCTQENLVMKQPASTPRTRKYQALKVILRGGNHVLRWLLRHGLAPRAFALLETTGRNTGRPRQTCVGNGLAGNTFWVIAAHSQQADWVRNIKEPRVRMLVNRRWRPAPPQS